MSDYTGGFDNSEECSVRGGLPNFFDKLHKGQPATITYLGGSITDTEGWRPISLKWFQEQYPRSDVKQFKATHSGTGSDLACFRLKRDGLYSNPDLLFVEFAVNDGNTSTERIYRGMEGIVRQFRRINPAVDICFVYTLTQSMLKVIQEGKLPNSVEAMEKIADYYNLPSIHLGLEVVYLEKKGKILFKGENAQKGKILFSNDGTHPLDAGHKMYSEALAHTMTKMEHLGTKGTNTMPVPFRKDNYENVKPTSLSKVQLSKGWKKLDPKTNPLAKEFHAKLPELWYCDQPGESITVRFKGTSIMLYDVMGPDCGQVLITVDDEKPRVEPRFNPWSERHHIYYCIGARDLENTEHTVRFEIHPEQPDKKKILSRRGIKMDDPNRYDGTSWYVGDVLVTGEVLSE